jgi:hypothetical protein
MRNSQRFNRSHETWILIATALMAVIFAFVLDAD